MRYILQLMRLLVAATIVVTIWLPVWLQYHTPTPSISDSVIERSRTHPSDDILDEISAIKHHLTPPMGRVVTDPVAEAEYHMQNALAAKGAFTYFDPTRLNEVDYASFIVPKTWLEAYEKSGNEKYFDAALQFILEFETYEHQRWLPRNFLWHDHSIAMRGTTLSKLWRIYRKRDDLDKKTAVRLLTLAAVCAGQLAKPSLYTFQSNHGTQQNIGLMHLVVAFPAIPGFNDYQAMITKRHDEHLNVLINDEGVILEHSAGYHRFGVELLAISLRYIELMKQPIPEHWIEKYNASRSVYEQWRQPDGALPRIGDTSDAAKGVNPWMIQPQDVQGSTLYRERNWQTPKQHSLYENGGYAIFWSGIDSNDEGLSQTTFSWSNYPGMGHKHADELSINTWTHEGRWWTNVGYWPYTDRNRVSALGWSGSNAPHMLGESAASSRENQLLGFTSTANASFADARRKGPGEFSARRQLVFVPPDLWLIFDWFEGESAHAIRTIWTTEPDVTVRKNPRTNSWLLERVATNARMVSTIVSDRPVSATLKSGSNVTPLGWVEVDYTPIPTHSIVVDQLPDTRWTLNSSLILKKNDAVNKINVTLAENPTPLNWSVRLHTGKQEFVISREDQNMLFESPDQMWRQPIKSYFDADFTMVTLSKKAFADAQDRYNFHHTDFITYRWKVTGLLLLLFIVQECIFFSARTIPGTHSRTLSFAVITLWTGIAAWLHLIYFAGS